MNEFQESLQELLIENNLNYTSLARIIDVSIDTISSYFVDGFCPTLEVSLKLSKYFKCSLDFLFGLSEERYSEYDIKVENANNNFVRNVARIIKLQNKSVAQVMRDIGIRENAYYRWQKGVKPRMSNIIVIAKYLGTSIDYLLGDIDEWVSRKSARFDDWEWT